MKFQSAPVATHTLRHPGVVVSSFVLALAVSPSGCGASEKGEGKNAKAGTCLSLNEAAPTFTALRPIEFPKSRVWIHAEIPMAGAISRIEKEILVILADEKNRDVGAPGKATYRVTRGAPTLSQTETGLSVRVPVSADISVCKPIGSACIRYGGCQPQFEASFSVATEIGKDYELSPPRGTIAATKKCVVGIDVTGQIENIAKQEVAKVQAQIAEEWPALKPDAKRGWKELGHPFEIAETTCVSIAPEKVFYTSPSIATKDGAQIISAAVGLAGELRPAGDCETRTPTGPLPSPSVAKDPDEESRLWIPEVVSLESAKASLLASLAGRWGESGHVEVLDIVFEKRGVSIHVKTSGEVCGEFWLSGVLVHTAGAGALRLTKLALAGSSNSNESVNALFAHLEGQAQVPVSSGEWFKGERLEPLSAALRGALPDEFEVQVRKMRAEDARVVAAEDGIYVLHPLSARLTITSL